ncbi:MAG: hypothetical protein A2W36_03960 [Chloroflexi bacterium RBG_16_58_14]|nr:MAG: hypothetical protein A2W36_03960 [Chloroflexi bacterium RBG_16_58_14]
MRILVLSYEYPPVGGGGGRAAQDLCQVLAKRGYELRVLTAHLKGLPRQEALQGVQIIRVPSLRRLAYKAGLLPMSGYVIAGLWAGLHLTKEWKPDLIHVHFAVPSGALAWALHRVRRIPYVLTAHLGDVPGGVPEKTDRWFRWLYPFTHLIWKDAARVAAVSEHTRQLAQALYPVEIQVIPNGVDLTSLDPGTIQPGSPPQIVFVGRFMPQKNPLQVVRTLASVKDLSWKCLMIGDGPLRSEVERTIADYGLQERIHLTGWITPEEVVAHYRESDILFMPSLSEGLPVSGVQALAMGLAILASRVGGWVDLVADQSNGYLVATGEEEKYTTFLSSLLSDPHLLLHFRLESRQKAKQFDLAAIADQYSALYEGIASV